MSRADEAPDTVARLNALAGGKILGATMGDGGFPAVLVRMPSGTEFWVDLQSDPEGNGPGFAPAESADPDRRIRRIEDWAGRHDQWAAQTAVDVRARAAEVEARVGRLEERVTRLFAAIGEHRLKWGIVAWVAGTAVAGGSRCWPSNHGPLAIARLGSAARQARRRASRRQPRHADAAPSSRRVARSSTPPDPCAPPV